MDHVAVSCHGLWACISKHRFFGLLGQGHDAHVGWIIFLFEFEIAAKDDPPKRDTRAGIRQHQSSLTYLYSRIKGSAVLWIRILVHSGTVGVSSCALQRESHEQADTFSSFEGERKMLGGNCELRVCLTLCSNSARM
jgi:hypothetical protein